MNLLVLLFALCFIACIGLLCMEVDEESAAFWTISFAGCFFANILIGLLTYLVVRKKYRGKAK
jgi:hypothetical protein